MKPNNIFAVLFLIQSIFFMLLFSINGYSAIEVVVIGIMYICSNLYFLAQEILDKIEKEIDSE